MIITITEVTQAFTQSGAEYLKVKGISDNKETTKSVFDNLKDKWDLIQPNTTLEFVVVKKGQFWNVTDVRTLGDKLPPVSNEKPLSPPAPEMVSSPAIGMITKELGDHIRAGTLSQVFGKKIAVELTKWYRGQVLGITRIPFQGADLPQYKTETNEERND